VELSILSEGDLKVVAKGCTERKRNPLTITNNTRGEKGLRIRSAVCLPGGGGWGGGRGGDASTGVGGGGGLAGPLSSRHVGRKTQRESRHERVWTELTQHNGDRATSLAGPKGKKRHWAEELRVT